MSFKLKSDGSVPLDERPPRECFSRLPILFDNKYSKSGTYIVLNIFNEWRTNYRRQRKCVDLERAQSNLLSIHTVMRFRNNKIIHHSLLYCITGSRNLQKASHIHQSKGTRNAHTKEARKRTENLGASEESSRGSSGRHQETRG